jgi:hypothetical protein
MRDVQKGHPARPQRGARCDESGAACLCAPARSTTCRIRRVTCVDAREMVSGPCLREPAVSSKPRRTISPARPEPAETGSLSRGRYVEALSDARTKLGTFFNILLGVCPSHPSLRGKRDAGRCEAAGSKKPEAYSLEYVEDFSGRERPRCLQIVCRSRMA